MTEKVDEENSIHEGLTSQLKSRREELERTQEIIQKLEIRRDRLESEVEKLKSVDSETTRKIPANAMLTFLFAVQTAYGKMSSPSKS